MTVSANTWFLEKLFPLNAWTRISGTQKNAAPPKTKLRIRGGRGIQFLWAIIVGRNYEPTAQLSKGIDGSAAIAFERANSFESV
jgi:hypothetical protein